jgi:hypothetical protein
MPRSDSASLEVECRHLLLRSGLYAVQAGVQTTFVLKDTWAMIEKKERA